MQPRLLVSMLNGCVIPCIIKENFIFGFFQHIYKNERNLKIDLQTKNKTVVESYGDMAREDVFTFTTYTYSVS